jgi:stage V sporulation protein G
MKTIKISFITVLSAVLFVGLTACGGSGDQSESQSVSMSESSSQSQSTTQSQSSDQSTPPRYQSRSGGGGSSRRTSGSVDAGAVMEETGVYPTELKTFQSGFAQLTLNGQLTVYSIKMPQSEGGYPTWPKDPGSERGQSELIYFENFDLKKALNQSITSEESRENAGGSLEITGMRANKYKSDSMRGFMDVTFNEAFTVNGAKLMKSDDGLWVAWPSQKAEDGNYYDLVSANEELNQKIVEMAREKMDL